MAVGLKIGWLTIDSKDPKKIGEWWKEALGLETVFEADDEFVAELVNPTPASEGFMRGIVWRGSVNASMTPQAIGRSVAT